VNKVLEVQPHSIRTFLGNLSDYIKKKKEEREQTEQQAKESATPQSREPQSTWQEQQKRRKDIAREVRIAKKKVEEAETQIHRIETRKKEIEEMLANPELYKNGEEAKLISSEYKAVQIQIEQTYAHWSVMTRQLEEIENRV
jgi:ATP-binding cassette subfamily F protein 3